MLYITIDDKQVQWHVGEELPVIYSRVVKFQADGDELELILAACKQSYGVHPGLGPRVEHEIRRLAREEAREEIQKYKDDEEIPF